MRRFLFLALLAASLLPGPVSAQATADQLNKLSLEALTAPSAGGGGQRYAPRSYRPRYQAQRYRAPSYGRARHYGYARRSYGRGVYRPRFAAPSRPAYRRGPVRHYAAPHAYRRGYRR